MSCFLYTNITVYSLIYHLNSIKHFPSRFLFNISFIILYYIVHYMHCVVFKLIIFEQRSSPQNLAGARSNMLMYNWMTQLWPLDNEICMKPETMDIITYCWHRLMIHRKCILALLYKNFLHFHITFKMQFLFVCTKSGTSLPFR